MRNEKTPYQKDIGNNNPRTPSSSVYPITFTALNARENMIFFGNSLRHECKSCGEYRQTSIGHKYCVHTICPIAIKESKKRRKRQVTTLGRVYDAKNERNESGL